MKIRSKKVAGVSINLDSPPSFDKMVALALKSKEYLLKPVKVSKKIIEKELRSNGFARLRKQKKRVQQVNEALITKVFTFYMLRDKQHVIDFVKQRWKKGERPDGSIIGTYAWVEYEMFKRQRNPLADGNVDLIDTGSLMEGIDLIPRIGANFSIFSTDAKFLLIVEQYGLDVFALTEEEQKVVIDIVQSETNMALYRYVIDNDSLPI